MFLVGHHDMVKNLCRATIVTGVKTLSGLFKDFSWATHPFDVADSSFYRRSLVKCRGISVKIAKISYKNCFAVVMDRAVIISIKELL